MIKVAILGATGYTALELIKLLLQHPHIEIEALTTRQTGNSHVSQVHPQLTGCLDLNLETLDTTSIRNRADCVFSCLPHAASAEVVAQVADDTTRVVDFSADYRLHDRQVYEQWYSGPHPDPARIGQVPYGLAEWFADEIKTAQIVANPGCYPTPAILSLAPLLKSGLIDPESIIIDSKSGVSGVGRTPKLVAHYPECNESIAAYSVGQHRHTPEIDQILSLAAGKQVRVIFTPHLVPMDRGILTTAYCQPTKTVTEDDVMNNLRELYAGSAFVRVVDHLPATKHTAGTNFCDITVRVVSGRIILISSIDNLVKGASGAAVQSMNLMFGFPETTALK